ncbi:MAG: DUF1549 domain-containing protein [Acidobacteriota bacterium]|nr:DUF1549 domain-containing protein [Acidobacteriota bacterium]
MKPTRRRFLAVLAFLAAILPGRGFAGSDCPLTASHADPDGRERRASVSRVTRAFAVSHPAGGASSAELTGVVTHVRRVFVNYVDEEIFGAMDAAKVTPAAPSSDAEFLRRATLDLTGRIPDAATVGAFLADPSADKRSRMVDTLLASDAFVDRWTFYYDELFQNTAVASSGRLYSQGRNAFHAYFQDAVRSHKPWDVMAREIIGAAGLNTTVGQANYVVRQLQSNGPIQDSFDNLAASTATVFLGTNAVFCTSCHNGGGHLDSINLWGSTVKRQDFWGMSAFYSRVTSPRSGTTGADYYYTVGERASGNYLLNTTTGNKTDRTSAYYTTTPAGMTSVNPAYLKTPLNPAGGAPAGGEGFRQALGRLVTTDPQFARAAVNYLWKEMFALGIVEPADAFDPLRQDLASPPPGTWTIQPTHPNLLTRLAADYAAHGYDLRYILGVMAKSGAYQLSSSYPGPWSEANTPYFARHFARRLPAETLFDAITRATGIGASIPVSGGVPSVSYAMQLPDVSEPSGRTTIGNFLNAFLRGDRDGDARSNEFSISQGLLMLNDTTITSRIKSTASGSAVQKLVAQNGAPAEIVASLYLSTLSRNPSAAELATGVGLFSSTPGETKAQIVEDLQFALLNKIDFSYNY